MRPSVSRLGAAITAAALGLSACAETDAPPVCDGLHRRPANPAGSVLTAPDPRPGLPEADPRRDPAQAGVGPRASLRTGASICGGPS